MEINLNCYPKEIFKAEPEILENFICPINFGILKNPIMDECGHSFCKNCIEKKKECPISSKKIEISNLIKNSLISKMVNNLEIFCYKKKNGCDFSGILENLENHIKNDCKFQKIKCENKNCEEEIIRQNLENHLKICDFRKIICKNCKKSEIFKNLENHNKICENIEISCIQNCEKKIIRKKMHFHIEHDCVNTEVSCFFIGCKKKEKRKSIQNHLNSSIGYIFHSKILDKRIFAVEEKMDEICKFITNYKNCYKNLKISHHELKKIEFSTKNSHSDIIINQNFSKGIKFSNNENFCFLTTSDFLVSEKVYKFKIKIKSEISIGISKIENLEKIGFSTNGKIFVNNFFFMNLKKIENFEFFEICFIFDKIGNKIIVKNLGSNRTSSLLTGQIEEGKFVVCFLLNFSKNHQINVSNNIEPPSLLYL